MSRIDSYYGASGYYQNTAAGKQEANKTQSKKTDEAAQIGRTKQPKISKRAQELLKKLQKTYGNMDFMVADYNNGDDAREILSRGTKEYSVLFSTEELEKMASDEKYEKEYMDRVQGAVRMSEEINRKYGFEPAFGKNGEKGEITRMGVAFDRDGTMTYFAELEKTSQKQQERIEAAREKRAQEKKADGKKSHREWDDLPVRKTVVEAASPEELLEKMYEIDWNEVAETSEKRAGRINYSV